MADVIEQDSVQVASVAVRKENHRVRNVLFGLGGLFVCCGLIYAAVSLIRDVNTMANSLGSMAKDARAGTIALIREALGSDLVTPIPLGATNHTATRASATQTPWVVTATQDTRVNTAIPVPTSTLVPTENPTMTPTNTVVPTDAPTAVAGKTRVLAQPRSAVIADFPKTLGEFYAKVSAPCPTGEMCTDWSTRMLPIYNDKGVLVGVEVPVIRSGENDVVSRYSIQNPWEVPQFGYWSDYNNNNWRIDCGLTLEETTVLGYQSKNVGATIAGRSSGIAEGFAFYRDQTGDLGKLKNWTVPERCPWYQK